MRVGLNSPNAQQERDPKQSFINSKVSGSPRTCAVHVLFQHLKQLRKQAAKEERLGKVGSGFQRRFKDTFAIRDDQFEKINQIALQCDSEVEELDGRAKAITEAFWAQHPPGKVPEGAVIPPPPPELKALQQIRNTTILRARDQMRSVLGEQEFTRINDHIRARVTPSIKRISN